MIHTVHTMTIGRYGRMDKTGDAGLLRLWYNPFPVKWFDRRVERFFNDLHEIMNTGEADLNLYHEVERTYMINKMLALSILYDALNLLLVIKLQVDMFLSLAEKKIETPQNLDFYLKTVKELTGIDCSEPGGMELLRDEIDRLSDKYSERYPVVEDQEKASFHKAALTIFIILDMPYNDRMTLAEFAELRLLADEKVKMLKKQKTDGGD